jgi:uncharacterized protein YebE (UPF0316 family)
MDLLSTSPWLLSGAIFLARFLDVSLGTLRTILVFRSYPIFAAMLGFLEIMVWVVAAGQVLQDLNRWYLIVAYVGGFAAGNIVGIWLESKLAVGTELVRAISVNRDVQLARQLRAANYSVIELAGANGRAPVEVLLISEKRRKVPMLLSLIEEIDPAAVCTISDIKHQVPEVDSPRPGPPRFLRYVKMK